MKINENKLAKDVTAREGGAQNLSIGQVKEVIKITLNLLASSDYRMSEVVALIEKHQ